MIGRREWFRKTITHALAAWGASRAGGLSSLAMGQSAPPKNGTTNRYTVRKPALSKSKNSTRTSADLGTLPIRADEQLGRLLESIRDAHHLPGMIGAIVRGDTLANIGAAGIRKIGSAEPMQVLDQVHLGSCTKAMTATLIGTLVDDGLLSWSSMIRDVFPEVASRLHPDFQTATLADLLTHRAGRPDDDRPAPGCSAVAPQQASPDQARNRLRLFQRRLRHGRPDGRTGRRPVMGRTDPAAIIRSAGNDLGRLRAARSVEPRPDRSTLGPSRDVRPVRAGAARQRPVHGAGRHRPLLGSRLGQVRRPESARRRGQGSPAQTGDVPDPAHSAAGQ